MTLQGATKLSISHDVDGYGARLDVEGPLSEQVASVLEDGLSVYIGARGGTSRNLEDTYVILAMLRREYGQDAVIDSTPLDFTPISRRSDSVY